MPVARSRTRPSRSSAVVSVRTPSTAFGPSFRPSPLFLSDAADAESRLCSIIDSQVPEKGLVRSFTSSSPALSARAHWLTFFPPARLLDTPRKEHKFACSKLTLGEVSDFSLGPEAQEELDKEKERIEGVLDAVVESWKLVRPLLLSENVDMMIVWMNTTC
jgi:hypothetical protein